MNSQPSCEKFEFIIYLKKTDCHRIFEENTSTMRFLLCTGQPGCGKTTLTRRAVEETIAYCGPGSVKGFYTEEVLGKDGKRIGFDVVTVSGERGVLSRKGGPTAWPKTGAYSVDVETFERIALPTLKVANDSQRAIVIDEIGRMELHSAAFRKAVDALLESPRQDIVVFGAITAPIYGHRVAYCDKVTAQKGVATMRLKKSTRESVSVEYQRKLKTLLRQSATPESAAATGKRKRQRMA